MSKNDETSALPDWVNDHIKRYKEDPDTGHNWDSTSVGGPGVLPVLLLTTMGRKTGKERTLPLIYGRTDAAYVIIASKGGAPRHPAWFLNLRSQPVCEIQVAHDHFNVRARVAKGTERQGLWEKLANIYPPYDDYQGATSRQIPVVVLEVI